MIVTNELVMKQLMEDYELFYELYQDALRNNDLNTAEQLLADLQEMNDMYCSANKEEIHRALYPASDF